MPLDLIAYRSDAERFLAEVGREHYLHFSGQKPECDFSSVFARYPDLFSRSALEDLRAHYAGIEDPWEKKQCAFLLSWVTETYLDEQLTALSDRIANAESAAVVHLDGEDIPYRYAPVRIANEADRERRRRLHRARLDTLARDLNPLYDAYWRRAHEVAVEIGFPTYEVLFADMKAMNHGLFRGEVQAFQQDTNTVYERHLHRLAQERLGLSLDDLEPSDMPYLFRAPEYDGYFSAARLLPTLHDTLAGLGIDLRAQQNVHLDTEPRPTKSPRAFCDPVRVPDEVYLSVMPHGGQDDYQALLHEAGHAEHFAHADPDRPFEYRCLGDNAVSEAFAFLFDHLPHNPLWLERYLGYGEAQDYVRFGYVSLLYLIRRYVGKYVYELTLHSQAGSLDAMAGVYAETLSDCLLIDVSPENYLADVDGGFYSAQYLRAWFLEGALRMILHDTYGKEWFASREAGEYLRSLWALGQQYNSPQLLLKIGGGKLNADPLRYLLEGVLGR